MRTAMQGTLEVATPVAAPVGNHYGRFSPDGREFIITDYRTPRPWANVIANPRLGLTVSQTGCGFSWVDNSQLAVITRWNQDLTQDSSGRFMYLRDSDSGQAWSLSPAPVWPAYERFACRHGLGYTTFETLFNGIEAHWTLFAHAEDTLEFWRVELRNVSDRLRRLELCAYLEWNCGVAPSPRREFHKLFLETEFDRQRRAIVARGHMWEVPNPQFGQWNMDFPYVSALACTEPLLGVQADKLAFIGRYGDPRAPAALSQNVWKPELGRHGDAIAALRCGLELKPGETRGLGFVLAVGESRAGLEQRLDRSLHVDLIDQALENVKAAWQARLAESRIDTPEPALNYLVNDWLRYQAISGRLWGRAGYYQQSGAFGFRDQLQDSQVWLTSEPARCRMQVNLHARHQFADGSVYHWWHPLSEQGHVTKMTDDLLWLAYVLANYIKETGGTSPFWPTRRRFWMNPNRCRCSSTCTGRSSACSGGPARAACRTSAPATGTTASARSGCRSVASRSGSVSSWSDCWRIGAEIYRRIAAGAAGKLDGDGAPRHAGDLLQQIPRAQSRAAEFDLRRMRLLAAINEHGWDGSWYIAATRDDGELLGSHRNRVCRVYLNTQTWAILNDVASPERARQAWQAVREHLVTDAGALLLWPAFDQPDERVGYITRYAPGLRENGGVYTHAATWALAAACKLRDHELVARLLTAINPALQDPERYWAEPYVLPGNVDGPDSPHFGRAGWTWYTGSAQWLHRVVTHWVLGVRPEWDGLRIDPCLPAGWRQARITRPWRGGTYDVRIERRAAPRAAAPDVTIDGVKLDRPVLESKAGERHVVTVECD